MGVVQNGISMSTGKVVCRKPLRSSSPRVPTWTCRSKELHLVETTKSTRDFFFGPERFTLYSFSTLCNSFQNELSNILENGESRYFFWFMCIWVFGRGYEELITWEWQRKRQTVHSLALGCNFILETKASYLSKEQITSLSNMIELLVFTPELLGK